MKPTIVTEGRQAVPDFWSSGILSQKLTQTPFLIFKVTDGKVEVKIVDRAEDFNTFYKDLPDDTKVMVQWKGEWRSDFFQTTVGEVREKYKNRNNS